MPLHSSTPTLHTILSNELLLLEISPLLPVSALLSLAATSKFFTYLVYDTPGVFRYLKLSTNHGRPPRSEVKTLYGTDYAGWTTGGLPPRDRYGQDLQNVFKYLDQKAVLQDVTTLVLDRLNLPSAMLRDVLCTDTFNIRLLSILGVSLFSEDAIMRVLRHLIRSSRPKGHPKLKGLYLFGPPPPIDGETTESIPSSIGVTSIVGAQLGGRHFRSVRNTRPHRDPTDTDRWYNKRGRVLESVSIGQDWADLLKACGGLIAFDAVLCRYCLQNNRGPKLASISLGGCVSCHSAPEGPAYAGISPEEYVPLVSPAPLHASTVRAAQTPFTDGQDVPPFFARCTQCLEGRWCHSCNVWWCESCYTIANPDAGNLSSAEGNDSDLRGHSRSIKVHHNLCVENCLVEDLYSGGGEGGMWG